MKLLILLCNIFGLFITSTCCMKVPVSEPSKIVVLVGTDRPESYTVQVVHQLVRAYREAGLGVALFSVTDFGPEFYSQQAYAHKPVAFTQFNDALLAAEVVVLVTPEYNATVPAPLTRVINLLSFPDSFTNKKFVIVSLSISPWGAARAHEQLKRTLIDLHACVYDEANLKIGEVQGAVKSTHKYAEHAQKVISFLQESVSAK